MKRKPKFINIVYYKEAFCSEWKSAADLFTTSKVEFVVGFRITSPDKKFYNIGTYGSYDRKSGRIKITDGILIPRRAIIASKQTRFFTLDECKK